MKNRFLTILILAGVVLIIFACKNDKKTSNNSNNDAIVVVSQDDAAIIERIVAFNKQVHAFRENPAIKTGETMTIEEAAAYFGIPDYHVISFEIVGQAYIMDEDQNYYRHLTDAEFARLVFVDDTAIAEESLMDN